MFHTGGGEFSVIERQNWRRNLHLGAGGRWSFKFSHPNAHRCLNSVGLSFGLRALMKEAVALFQLVDYKSVD